MVRFLHCIHLILHQKLGPGRFMQRNPSSSPTSVLPLRAEILKSIAKTCMPEKLEC